MMNERMAEIKLNKIDRIPDLSPISEVNQSWECSPMPRLRATPDFSPNQHIRPILAWKTPDPSPNPA